MGQQQPDFLARGQQQPAVPPGQQFPAQQRSVGCDHRNPQPQVGFEFEFEDEDESDSEDMPQSESSCRLGHTRVSIHYIR